MLFTFFSYSQISDHNNDHHGEKFELGGAFTAVYSINENIIGPGYHIHVLRLLNDKFGLGASYEAAFLDNYHQAITFFGEFIFYDFLSIDLGPGILLPSVENPKSEWVAHIEFSTAFNAGPVHFGPMIGYGIGKNDSHLSAGIHLGWHF